MKSVDTIARIRRDFFVRSRTIRENARDLHIARSTVHKVDRSNEIVRLGQFLAKINTGHMIFRVVSAEAMIGEASIETAKTAAAIGLVRRMSGHPKLEGVALGEDDVS